MCKIESKDDKNYMTVFSHFLTDHCTKHRAVCLLFQYLQFNEILDYYRLFVAHQGSQVSVI